MGLGFRIESLGFRVQCLGPWGLGSRVWGLGLRVAVVDDVGLWASGKCHPDGLRRINDQ